MEVSREPDSGSKLEEILTLRKWPNRAEVEAGAKKYAVSVT